MKRWAGKLFVFRDALGREHISLIFPQEEHATTLRAFQISGPYIPIGLRQSMIVDDADAWLKSLENREFKVSQCAAD